MPNRHYRKLAFTLALALIQISKQGLDWDAQEDECSHFLVRQEWRSLSQAHKAEYIAAVKCTQSLPARSGFEAAQTRFDDFQAVHIHVADEIHIVGHFLPWHRRFIKIHETTLREECGYRGAIPYWDWTLDADSLDSISESPIFDPVHGFGGDGVPGTYILPNDPDGTSELFPETFVGCVQDGPFASHKLHIGPGKLSTDHCLVRGLNDTYKGFLTSEAVAQTMEQPTFELFRVQLEGGGSNPYPAQHGSGHLIVGGDMGNLFSSPGDPLFHLHHANLDRLWWQWQEKDLPTRFLDISGRLHANSPRLTQVTLNYRLDFHTLAPPMSVRDTMDIQKPPFCYAYV